MRSARAAVPRELLPAQPARVARPNPSGVCAGRARRGAARARSRARSGLRGAAAALVGRRRPRAPVVCAAAAGARAGAAPHRRVQVGALAARSNLNFLERSQSFLSPPPARMPPPVATGGRQPSRASLPVARPRQPPGRRARSARPPPPPPPSRPPPRTKWTRRVPHPVLIGHAAPPHPTPLGFPVRPARRGPGERSRRRAA